MDVTSVNGGNSETGFYITIAFYPVSVVRYQTEFIPLRDAVAERDTGIMLKTIDTMLGELAAVDPDRLKPDPQFGRYFEDLIAAKVWDEMQGNFVKFWRDYAISSLEKFRTEVQKRIFDPRDLQIFMHSCLRREAGEYFREYWYIDPGFYFTENFIEQFNTQSETLNAILHWKISGADIDPFSMSWIVRKYDPFTRLTRKQCSAILSEIKQNEHAIAGNRDTLFENQERVWMNMLHQAAEGKIWIYTQFIDY